MDYKREVQVRLRVEAIFNKNEDEFASKQEYDDYLEEREDIIFNLVERTNVKEMEAKIEDYRRNNADSIVRNEARKAEHLRRTAAEQAQTAEAPAAAAEHAGVSGTAAAFHGGQDAEPHQGMDYTATLSTGVAALGSTAPIGPVTGNGDIEAPRGKQSKEEWLAMATASGWSEEFPRKKAWEAAFKSMYIALPK